MAYKGKIILNSKTGIETKFLQTSKDTGGQLLEMETTYPARSLKPPPHYHPHQEEDFVILSGEMTVNMDGQLRILKQGDTLHIPRNMVHAMWNHTKEKTVVNWQVRPALDSEYFFETTTGLANDGKTSRGGRPNMLQTAVLMTCFSDEFLLVKPPRWVQRLVFGLLAPVGWLLGYRGVYRKYLD
ncbi:MAG: cupin domain-containing protein [Haliscomenobacteraceae bacterium CHB4]|nr:hypothetical protein [Saprospiraceae bacterium]MCE7921540.1 cupin domain-containing protein [Haliscomenobacteraceae bacterium CHB4]